MRASLWVYLIAIARTSWYLGVGLLAGIAGLILDVSGGSFPRWMWELLLGIVFLVAPLLAFHHLRMEGLAQEAMLRGQLADAGVEHEEQIRGLRDELAELERRTPQLRLQFADGADQLIARVTSNPLTPQRRAELLAEVRRKYPKWDVEPAKPSTGRSGVLASDIMQAVAATDWVLRPSADSIKRYNERLDSFYQNWDRHLSQRAAHDRQRGLTVELDLVLANVGSWPAEDIDVDVTLVGSFDILEELDYPEPPDEPEPPEKPKGDFFSSGPRDYPGLFLHRVDAAAAAQPEINVFAPDIIYDQDTRLVRFHVRRLKHNREVELDRLHLVFESFEAASAFDAPYRVNIGNSTQELAGKLRIVISK